ncbi:hypothetical protein [Eleftheria terrae]|uniref:hypothetical protein n=1 Tax=Eleftheria terrae TaxID=1597781 RepID=UPI00263B2D9E|nr:hypothetical protein [Eleftheria terrae]WKB54863.1 hypothetical protein N7L95_10970 [Eleftheria terrae]
MTFTSRRQLARHTPTAALGRGLGWFSIGLGVAQLLMPQTMGRLTGLQGRTALMRACGLREIATGIGMLASRNAAPWAWARVAGDAFDAAALASQWHPADPLAHRTAGALAAVAAVGVVDVIGARALQAEQRRLRAPVPDYSHRSGLPRSPESMRGAALADFDAPRDMRTPAPLRPYQEGVPAM